MNNKIEVSNTSILQEVYKLNSNSTSKIDINKSKKRDDLNVSSKGKDFQTVIRSLNSKDENREAKVLEIKEKFDNGDYRVNAESIVDKILGI